MYVARFEWTKLMEIINKICSNVKVLNNEVVYCTLSTWSEGSDVFVFAPYGSVVTWFASLTLDCNVDNNVFSVSLKSFMKNVYSDVRVCHLLVIVVIVV